MMTRRKHQHPTITITLTFALTHTLTAATAHVIVVDILGHFPIAGTSTIGIPTYSSDNSKSSRAKPDHLFYKQ
jgi:hypothetical protein